MATNVELVLDITSHSSVASTSQIVIDFPANTYSRINALVSPSCSYSILGNTYSSCVFSVDNLGWVTQVNLTNLGSSNIPVNSTITVKMVLTNAWTNKAFGSSKFSFYVESADNSFLSHGVLAVTTINSANNFIPTTVSSLILTETSLFASQNNNITINFILDAPVPIGSIINVMLPKSIYTMNLSAIQASATPATTI